VSRVKRFAIALGASLGLGVGLALAFVILFLATAVAFSGSTGAAHQRFWNSLTPVGYFVIGAGLGASAVGILNSVTAGRGVWWLAIVFVAFVVGITAAVVPALGASLTSTVGPAIGVAAKLVMGR
jgi:hypothetical protein